MTTIKERAVALNLAEKLCVRPQGTYSGAACFGIGTSSLSRLMHNCASFPLTSQYAE